jgi:hypothetical protein
MHRHADLIVLLEHDHIMAAGGELAGGDQTRGAAADDGDVSY